MKLSTNQTITKFESKNFLKASPSIKLFLLRIHAAVCVELEQVVWPPHVLEAPNGRVGR